MPTQNRTRPLHCRLASAGFAPLLGVLLSLLLGSGCNKLKITPPTPNKSGRAGEGAAMQLASAPSKKTSDATLDDPHWRRNHLLREFDDDIAAWHKAYAMRDRNIHLLESSLTKRALEHYDELADAARDDNVPFAMVARTALAFANREDAVPLLLRIAREHADVRVVRNALNGLGILADVASYSSSAYERRARYMEA